MTTKKKTAAKKTIKAKTKRAARVQRFVEKATAPAEQAAHVPVEPVLADPADRIARDAPKWREMYIMKVRLEMRVDKIRDAIKADIETLGVDAVETPVGPLALQHRTASSVTDWQEYALSQTTDWQAYARELALQLGIDVESFEAAALQFQRSRDAITEVAKTYVKSTGTPCTVLAALPGWSAIARQEEIAADIASTNQAR